MTDRSAIEPFDPATETLLVTGLPRSGTSMLMQMLVAGGIDGISDGARRADYSNPAGYFEDERVKRLRQDNSWLAETSGSALKVVAPLLPFLPDDLQARAICMLRDTGEIVHSQRVMLDRAGEQGAKLDPNALAQQFDMLMKRTQALLSQRFPGKVLYVEHRRCIAEPRVTAAEIAAFCGIEPDLGLMAAVVRPELYRNRSGV